MTDDSLHGHLPDELTDRDQWVCWRTEDRDGKPTKIPVDPSNGRFASTTDCTTWSPFDRAHEYARVTEAVAGLGFVFTEDDPFVGVDLDDCRDPETGQPTTLAKDIIDRLDSYTEISPSETGYHVIVRGTLPGGRNRHGSVECYATSRYFTMTGDHVSETPERVEERSDVLASVHAEYVAPEALVEAAESPRPARTLEDEELVQKATQAVNGDRFDSLWTGSTNGYSSHSEADMALCCHLAFWTGGDPDQMDRLFRDSGLIREKWDEVHFADGSTYGEKTISRAIERVSEYYTPTDTQIETGIGSTETRTQDTNVGQNREQVGIGTHHDAERLRTTIERLDKRIESLETENKRLCDQLERASSSDKPSPGAPQASNSESLWLRVKRFFLSS